MRCETRRLPLLALAVLVSGCGNYSNADLEFFNALPSREDIKSNLPEEGDPVSKAPSSPDQAVRTALVAAAPATLGQPARLYEDTRNAAHLFKSIAEVFVRLVAEVQRHRPTTRTVDQRTWGPFPIREHEGFEFLVTIQRDPAATARFDYRFEFRPEGGADDAWVAFISGSFIRAEGRLGTGTLLFENRVLVDAGISTNLQLDWLQIDYDTHGFPATVRLEFARLLDTFTFRHAEHEDGGGSMQFVFEDAFSATFEVSSRWNPHGAGRADATVTRLFGPMGTLSQCWDPAFLLTFHQNDFEEPNLLGHETACPTDLPQAPLPAPGVP